MVRMGLVVVLASISILLLWLATMVSSTNHSTTLQAEVACEKEPPWSPPR